MLSWTFSSSKLAPSPNFEEIAAKSRNHLCEQSMFSMRSPQVQRLARVLVWYVYVRCHFYAFPVPHARSIAIPTCKGNICRLRYPTHRTCFQVPNRVSSSCPSSSGDQGRQCKLRRTRRPTRDHRTLSEPTRGLQ